MGDDVLIPLCDVGDYCLLSTRQWCEYNIFHMKQNAQ